MQRCSASSGSPLAMLKRLHLGPLLMGKFSALSFSFSNAHLISIHGSSTSLSSMSTLIVLFGALGGLPRAAALSSSEEWADFTDNFATDLAPLITLFGEQVTKQFLSESTGVLDCIIFGMAPIGILTAVVSVIRLYGEPWLKSVIGRAQEPHGVPEAELCSSTSDDVCELWSNGTICRVFGRPKILEFIYSPEDGSFHKNISNSSDTVPDCGIFPLKYALTHSQYNKGAHMKWTEDGKGPPKMYDPEGLDQELAPFPNLSLNVGIRKTKRRVLLGVGAFGILLQASVFIYATWATFYNLSFYEEDDTPPLWYFVLAIAGTALLVCGMILCAALVEKRSTERHFKANLKSGQNPPRIYWLQCGNQRVADQQFSSFAHFQSAERYMTSWLADSADISVFGMPSAMALKVAVSSSLLGFVCQFVGLRGVHGSITLYQLACTLVMSIIRALLRSRRFSPDNNRLVGFKRQCESDELDWQALDIVRTHLGFPSGPCSVLETGWRLLNSDSDTRLSNLATSNATERLVKSVTSSDVVILTAKGNIGSGLVGFRSINPAGDLTGDFWADNSSVAAEAFLRAVQEDSQASLLELIAQDIFAIFMFEAASVVDDLGSFAVRQPPNWQTDTILRNRNAASSLLSNTHIDALARILCESGLATEEAALMTIVPAFHHQSKLPSLDAAVAKVLDEVRQMRVEGKYELGEAHLKRLLRFCSPEHHEKVARALGELYRAAWKSSSALHRDFGLRAMASLGDLASLTPDRESFLSDSILSTLRDYQELSSGSDKAAVDASQPDWIRQLHARHGDEVVHWCEKTKALATLLASSDYQTPAEPQADRGRRGDPIITALLDIGVAIQPGELLQALYVRLPDDIFAALLARGKGIVNSARDSDGKTLLQVLLNYFWNGTAAERDSATPLQISCAWSDVNPPKAYSDQSPLILLRAGADPNLRPPPTVNPESSALRIRSTPLELACLTGKAEVVDALLKAGAHVNTTGGEFGPPLQAACLWFGQRRINPAQTVKIVRILLAAGADVNGVSLPCGSALTAAIYSVLPEVVQVLLDAGASPDLSVPRLTGGDVAFFTAWDALQPWPSDFTGELGSNFARISQFWRFPRVDDATASGGRRRIRELLNQHRMARPMAEQPGGPSEAQSSPHDTVGDGTDNESVRSESALPEQLPDSTRLSFDSDFYS
ncbi:hypothetical protein VTJ49DRAFT_5475 [Mycothermus thermophilus]|uniref:Ankyrin repeat protein n=1 Tax=Humicola insolens TaxID=85995 RepID=A0ABR3V4I1_HUMIN